MKCILYLLSVFLFAGACSTSKWVVTDTQALDRENFEIKDTNPFLAQTGEVSPENPVFRLGLFNENTFEYVQKIQLERQVQRYRPKTGYFIAGLLASGFAIYTTNFAGSNVKPTGAETFITTAGGLGLLAMAFLNSKPVGEPSKTGERRLTRASGKEMIIDTVRAVPELGSKISVAAFYGSSEVIPRRDRDFSNGQISINLASEINPINYGIIPENSFRIEVAWEGIIQNFMIPVDAVFQSFVEVIEASALLRSHPEINNDNIIIELRQGSQLQVSEIEREWAKVKYGSIEGYLKTEGLTLLWRPDEFSNRLSLVEVPFVPFGNIDIETNIPILTNTPANASALVITNENLPAPFTNKKFANRDGELIEAYLLKALAYPQENIFTHVDVQTGLELEQNISRFSKHLAGTNQAVFVFLSGKVIGEREDSLKFLASNPIDIADDSPLLSKIFADIGRLPAEKLFVVVDLDFSGVSSRISRNYLQQLSREVLIQNTNSILLFASQQDQNSSIYESELGEQKRHSIFSYFLADALKSRKIIWREIFNHLQSNVSYTSRRLNSRPQDPQVFGNLNMRIID